LHLKTRPVQMDQLHLVPPSHLPDHSARSHLMPQVFQVSRANLADLLNPAHPMNRECLVYPSDQLGLSIR